VMPQGTFRLELTVRGLYDVRLPEAKSPVSANIDVIAGVGTGQRASFVFQEDLPSFYVLYGLAGPVTIAVSSPAFVSQTIELTVQGHLRHDIVLSPAAAPPPE
jgi:hypothetical protein